MQAMRGLGIGQAAPEKGRIRDKYNTAPSRHSAANGTGERDSGSASDQKGRSGQHKARREKKQTEQADEDELRNRTGNGKRNQAGGKEGSRIFHNALAGGSTSGYAVFGIKLAPVPLESSS